MNWFSVPICRLYPGLVCPFFMASSFMRMNATEHIRLVIELKRDANPNVVLNNLFKYTQMQDTFGMERVGSITRTLFFMEVIVLDEGFYPLLLHEPVIFFRTVTGVCHADIR